MLTLKLIDKLGTKSEVTGEETSIGMMLQSLKRLGQQSGSAIRRLEVWDAQGAMVEMWEASEQSLLDQLAVAVGTALLAHANSRQGMKHEGVVKWGSRNRLFYGHSHGEMRVTLEWWDKATGQWRGAP